MRHFVLGSLVLRPRIGMVAHSVLLRTPVGLEDGEVRWTMLAMLRELLIEGLPEGVPEGEWRGSHVVVGG